MRACHGRRRPPDRSGSRMGHGVSWGAQRVGIRPSRSASLPQTTSCRDRRVAWTQRIIDQGGTAGRLVGSGPHDRLPWTTRWCAWRWRGSAALPGLSFGSRC